MSVSEKRYTLHDGNTAQPVAGLVDVSAENANLLRLICQTPMRDLELHGTTLARDLHHRAGEWPYLVIRTV